MQSLREEYFSIDQGEKNKFLKRQIAFNMLKHKESIDKDFLNKKIILQTLS